MEKIFSAGNLVLLWLLFTVLSPLLYAVVFAWGLRSGQFSRPKRCAALPLDSYIPEEGREGPPEQPDLHKESEKNVSF